MNDVVIDVPGFQTANTLSQNSHLQKKYIYFHLNYLVQNLLVH